MVLVSAMVLARVVGLTRVMVLTCVMVLARVMSLLRGSNSLSARRARRTKSRGPKGLQIEVEARRALRLLVLWYWSTQKLIRLRAKSEDNHIWLTPNSCPIIHYGTQPKKECKKINLPIKKKCPTLSCAKSQKISFWHNIIIYQAERIQWE